jgi:hypothetical protein
MRNIMGIALAILAAYIFGSILAFVVYLTMLIITGGN